MKNTFFRLTALAAVALSLMAFSCKSTESAGEPAPATSEPVVQEETVLVSTDPGEWSESVFASADQHGYFFTTPEIGQYSMIEGEFKKSGGYEQSGFGFVFGYTADDEGWLADYLRFEITTSGHYSAYACRGSTYIDLVESNSENTAYRYEASAIKGGYDSVNKLKIERTGEKDYNLYINGSKVISFTAPDGFSNSDGVMAFFSVGKADQEQFPDKPVRVTYRVTDSTVADKVLNEK